MSYINTNKTTIVALIVAAFVFISAPQTLAFDREQFEQRRVEREEAREARRIEREAERAQRDAEREAAREARRIEREAEESNCRCSASISYGKPTLRFNGSTLEFKPSVSISVRSRGDIRTPWTAHVDLSGETDYSSEDITPPTPVQFSRAADIFNGHCGDRVNFDGWNNFAPVPLTGLTRNLTGQQEIEGMIRMNATLSACDVDTESSQFKFKLMDFGNLRTYSWGTIRSL